MSRQIARMILLTAGVIWGFGFIVNKYVLDNGWGDTQLLFVRFFSATLFMFLIFFRRIIKTDKDTVKKGMFLGVFLFLGFFFQTWGLEETTASKNALITAGYIIALPLIIYIFERKFVGWKSYFAGLITFTGIVIVTVNFNKIGSGINQGDILTFIGAMFWGIHLYFLGKMAKTKDPINLMAFQLVVVSILSFVAMMVKSGFPEIDYNDFSSYSLLIAAIAIGFLASFIGFVFQSIGQKYTPAPEAAILISTESIFGPLFAILFYNELFSIRLLFGMIFVFFGIILSELDVFQLIKYKKNNRI